MGKWVVAWGRERGKCEGQEMATEVGGQGTSREGEQERREKGHLSPSDL